MYDKAEKMNTMKVVVIAHNQCNLVKVQLDSLVRLSGLRYEDIIIVDNYWMTDSRNGLCSRKI